MRENVQIKGTKEGIKIFLNDKASIQELEIELLNLLKLQEKKPYLEEKLAVQMQIGNRLLSEEEEKKFAQIVREHSQMKISTFYSNVMTKSAAKKWKESDQIHSIISVIRSGQIIEVPGDCLLIGDINPGGQIRAQGNIFVLGTIKGIVHAGFEGNKKAIVVGKFIYPSQIRIGNKFSSFTNDFYEKIPDTQLFSAYIDKNDKIIIDEIHKIRKIRPEISNFQGGY